MYIIQISNDGIHWINLKNVTAMTIPSVKYVRLLLPDGTYLPTTQSRKG